MIRHQQRLLNLRPQQKASALRHTPHGDGHVASQIPRLALAPKCPVRLRERLDASKSTAFLAYKPAGASGCFYRLGGPFFGSPCSKSPTIWGLKRAPDFWKPPRFCAAKISFSERTDATEQARNLCHCSGPLGKKGGSSFPQARNQTTM